MKHKLNKKIGILLFLVVIISTAIVVGAVLLNNNTSLSANEQSGENMKRPEANSGADSELSAREKETIISTTAEVQSALVESLEPHATYYLEEVYVVANQALAAGENILKYTNGEYMIMPYDGVITEINLAEVGGQCTNEHFVKISSTGVLQLQFKVDEAKIDQIELGNTARITDSAEGDEVQGVVTKISSTASNGKFTVTVEFENDGKTMLGMTRTVEI